MKKVFLTILNICLIVFIVNAQDVVKKANNFIDLLSTEQKKQAPYFPLTMKSVIIFILSHS